MRQHRTDLFALLTGLAFAIAGTAVLVSQQADTDISAQWVAATGLILLGVVALTVTLFRNRPAPFAEPLAEGPTISSASPADAPTAASPTVDAVTDDLHE